MCARKIFKKKKTDDKSFIKLLSLEKKGNKTIEIDFLLQFTANRHKYLFKKQHKSKIYLFYPVLNAIKHFITNTLQIV